MRNPGEVPSLMPNRLAVGLTFRAAPLLFIHFKFLIDQSLIL